MKVDIKENKVEKIIKLPHLGQRIMKTGIAVFLCCLIYVLRGYDGMVSQSAVAAIICMQPFKEDSIKESVGRINGTLIGAVWGLGFLWLMKTVPILSANMIVVYFLMAVGVIVTLYFTVVMKKTNSSGLAAIVFLSIVLNYPDLKAPLAQTIDRLVDTLIGIIVAGVVNSFSMPRKKHFEYIFFVRLQDLVPDRYAQVSPSILVMLNRLYNDGARISLVSKWPPAFLLSQMVTLNINLPVIVMDGAAMYDIPNKEYLHVISMAREDVDYLRAKLNSLNLGYLVYTVKEGTMLIYRQGKMNWAEEQEYEMMKRSPYRNYIDDELGEHEEVTFIRTIGTDEDIDHLEEDLRDFIMEGRYRIVRRPQPKMEGYSGLYFYDTKATVENQKKNMIEDLTLQGDQGIVPVDMHVKGSYDSSEREAVQLLTKLRSVYEPISFR